MKTRFFIVLLFLLANYLQAKETPVNPGTFSAAYTSAADGDILVLAEGTYAANIDFPNGKAITLKAAEGASPVFTAEVKGATTSNNGSLTFDGVNITRNGDYFFSADIGNINLLSFRNLTISSIGRCLLRTNNTGNTINKIEFENCIIKNCGGNGWNLLYPKHIVKSVSVKNSTLYNYTNGESFFSPNASDATNVLEFVFENNTVYKWAKDSSRALANVGKNYSASSTYLFRNNIISEPGVAGYTPNILNVSAGIVTAENNLVVNYGTYAGGTQTISDLTLAGLGISSLGFPDPANGDFSILSTSPLATAGVGGKPVGDPRWVKQLAQAVNLTTSVSPVGAGTVSPVSAAFEKDEQATVTATHNYGYRFKEWQKTGQKVSVENPYSFQISEDVELTAVFNVLDTYTLTVNKEGEGANWGTVKLSPEPVDGVYEAGTQVTVTVIPNDVTTFLSWEDQSNAVTRQVVMDGNKNLTATFDWVPFIVGWSFDPSEPRGNRPGDFYSRTDNTGVMKFFNADGSSTNWGGSTKNFGGVTYTSARRYTDYANMSNPRYFQAEFSAKGQEQTKYKNIRITSYVAADNACVHKIQKLQYATSESGPYTDLASVDLTTSYNASWVELSGTLPELTEDQKTKIYVRWVADTNSGFLGTPGSTESEGFYLANVIVYADMETEEDLIAPALLSSIPGEGTNTASANGSIVLTFDKRVKAGVNGGKVELNGETLTPVFGNKTVSYPYKKLSYGTQYSFTIPVGAITNVDGIAYEGKSLTFSTMERPQPIAKVFDAVVAADGSGDYLTISEAISNTPENRSTPWLIYIKNGEYKEIFVIPTTKPFIHLIGQDKEKTIIHEKINSQGDPANDVGQSYYPNSLAAWEYSVNNPLSPMAAYKSVTSGAVVKVNATDFYAENITFRNDWGVEAQNGPMALAMYSNNDRISFYNCKFRSFQDTWQTSSNNINDRLYVRECWIEGAVDYFYGGGNAFVDESTMYNVRSGSVIVACSHKTGTLWGYVFNNCIVDGNSSAADGKLKLGRPWHNEPIAVYLNTTMKILPHPEGWTDMGPAAKLYAEYNSMDASGKPIDLSNRRTWYIEKESGQKIEGLQAVLTQEEAAVYTYENVVGGSDDWNPRSKFEPVTTAQKLTIDDSYKLEWESVDYAICYVVYRNDEVIGFTTSTEFEIEATLRSSASYYVQAVNEYGSLSAISDEAKPKAGVSIKDEAQTSELIVTVEKNVLTVKNIELGKEISLYSIDGKQVLETKATSDIIRISTSVYKGVFVLKVGNKSVKVIL